MTTENSENKNNLHPISRGYIYGYVIVWEGDDSPNVEIVQAKVGLKDNKWQARYSETIFSTLDEALQQVKSDGNMLIQSGHFKKISARIYPLAGPPTRIESHSSPPAKQSVKVEWSGETN